MSTLQQKLIQSIQSLEKNVEIAQQMNVEQNNPMNQQLLSVITNLKDCVESLSEIVIPEEMKQKQKEEKKEIQQQIRTTLTDEEKDLYSLKYETRDKMDDLVMKRMKSKEILGTIGKAIDMNFVDIRGLDKFCPSNNTYMNIIKYLCEKVAPFVFYISLLNGQIIGILFRKKTSANSKGVYHFRNNDICLIGSHFENGNLVMDTYESKQGHIEIRTDGNYLNFFEIKIHGVGKYSSAPYQGVVERMNFFTLSKKKISSELYEGLTSPSLLCNEDLYCRATSFIIGIHRKNAFTVEKKPSIDTTQLSSSLLDIIKTEKRKPLEYYEELIKKNQMSGQEVLDTLIDNTPILMKIPYKQDVIRISSHWINLIRTEATFAFLRMRYGLTGPCIINGLQHFTDYVIPECVSTLLQGMLNGFPMSLFYLLSEECAVGVVFTKQSFGSISFNPYHYPPSTLKLFFVILKDGILDFREIPTNNSMKNNNTYLLEPYVVISPNYQLMFVDAFLNIINKEISKPIPFEPLKAYPLITCMFSPVHLPSAVVTMFKENELNPLSYVLEQMKTKEYQQHLDNGKFSIVKLIKKKK